MHEARELAAATLATISSPATPLQLADDEAVADIGWGFVFPWNNARWFVTRKIGDAAPPGAGPLVVDKATRDVFWLDSATSIDEQLAAYAREHGLPACPTLGW